MSFTKEEEEFPLIKIITTCQHIPQTKTLADEFITLINSNLPADEIERRCMSLYNKITKVLKETGFL